MMRTAFGKCKSSLDSERLLTGAAVSGLLALVFGLSLWAILEATAPSNAPTAQSAIGAARQEAAKILVAAVR